jgi:cysteine synthase
MIANSIVDLVGKTPMLRINKSVGPNDATVYAKLEWYNIGGTLKDRMELYVVEYAEATGLLDKNKSILETTSASSGIALAMIASVKGYHTTIVTPESVSLERRKIIRAFGAELVLSPGDKGIEGAVAVKQKLLEESPEKYVDLDQFKDPANILANYQTTGKEIIDQTSGKVDMVIVGIGTAGTGVGISNRLKDFNRDIKVIGVLPKLGVSAKDPKEPKNPSPTQMSRMRSFDEIVELTKEDVPELFDVAKKVAREEGLFIGISSAAMMYVALNKAKELGKGKVIVAILPDNADKYVSTDVNGPMYHV